MYENAERLQSILAKRGDLREKINEAAAAYTGDTNDDRAVYEAVIAPVARSVGIDLSYDEAIGAALDGRELTDEELELAAGGVGGLHRMLISGALAATMVFGSIPAQAFAQGAGQGSATSADIEAELAAEQQAALDAITYTPDFSLSDVALPDGVAATPEGLVATNDEGRQILSLVANAEDGDEGKDEGGFVSWDNAEKAVEYTAEKLGFVGDDAKKVASLGKALFDMIKGGATGDLGGILDGGKAFLVLTGAIEAEDDGPSNADLMNEINELNSLMKAMDSKLDENIKAVYQDRLTPFDTALAALETECAKVEDMYKRGYELAAKRGLLERGEEPEVPQETEMPAEPTLELPAEPTLELPAEPVAAELPAEPTLELPEGPKNPGADYFSNWAGNTDGDHKWEEQCYEFQARYGIEPKIAHDWEFRMMWFKEATAAWQAECDQLKADHELAMIDWQVACERITAENEKAKADWQAECDRITAEHEKAVSDWQAECDRMRAEYEQALTDWHAECDRIHEANEKAKTEYEAKHDEWSEDNISKRLRVLMREEDDKGTNGFTDFKSLMESIRINYENVAAECAKGGGASPFYAYDSYWALHFNFDTQGYYLRQAYRTNAEYQLKRAYSLLGLYYDIPSALEINPKEPYTVALQKALNGIEAMPAGNSPESVRGQASGLGGFYYNVPVHSYTLNKDFKRSGVYDSMATMPAQDSYITDKQLEAFCKRLHGRTIAEDLRLAGVMADWDDAWAQKGAQQGENISASGYLGLGLRHEIKKHAFSDNEWITYYVPFDATSADVQSYDNGGKADYSRIILNLNTV